MSDRAELRVLGFAGSLRATSYNRSLLRAAQLLAPAGMTIVTFDLESIPLYNGDVEERGMPSGVDALNRAIHGADALLIVTPEYQHGTPGVLKNALDWVSRPAGRSSMRGKAAAIMGASTSVIGTARAQQQLRVTLEISGASVVMEPEVLIGRVHEKVDADGNFIDESANPFIVQLLEKLAALAWSLRDGGESASVNRSPDA